MVHAQGPRAVPLWCASCGVGQEELLQGSGIVLPWRGVAACMCGRWSKPYALARPAECKNKEQVLVRTCITSAYCFVACVRVYSAAYVLLSTAQRSKAAAVVSLARRGHSGQKNASPRLRFWPFGVGDGASRGQNMRARAGGSVCPVANVTRSLNSALRGPHGVLHGHAGSWARIIENICAHESLVRIVYILNQHHLF
jgi:hypothetical protein